MVFRDASDDVRDDLLDLAVAVLAYDPERVLRPHDELGFDRLAGVRDAVRVRAPEDADRAIRERDAALLGDVVIPDHVHGRRRRDEGDLVDLPRTELAVLDLHDVLPSHGAAWAVHGDPPPC